MSNNKKQINPVTDIILKTVNNLKVNSPPLYTEVIKSANKYQQQALLLSQAGVVLADTIARLTIHNQGDFGDGFKKLADSLRELETKREEVIRVLVNELITPCKQNIENDQKDIVTFEKNYKKERDQMRQDILKLEARTKKAGKKTTPEVLKQQITELNDKIKESEQLNANRLRDVVLMERKKHSTFLSQFNQFLDKEVELANETNTKLTGFTHLSRELINTQNQLPSDCEAMISKQERTLVQIQPHGDSSDNYRISYAGGKSGGSDAYESYESYDNYDYSYDDTAGGSGSVELQARALYDYESGESTDLNLRAGDTITVVQQDDGSGWTKGRDSYGNEGIFPSSYIEYI